jgi:hypothetical protein
LAYRRIVRRPLIALVAVATVALGGCRDDHVTIAYHPAPGSTFDYTVHVESSTVTVLPDRSSDPVKPAPADLTARQRVLDSDGATTRVEVTLGREGIGSRTFVMRFDRAAQLTAVESVEGIPAGALGSLGLSEIFPAAAGAPPDRPLRPGDRWTIDDKVQLAGMSAPARLTGVGHLVRLGVVDGHDTATVESSTTLPLTATSESEGSVQTLTGTQTTTITVVYDLASGAVRHSTATTKGSFALTLAPPPGQAGSPIEGTLTVEVRSEIRRAG